jgi:hypothetical protein
VRVVEQWRTIEASLPDEWSEAKLALTVGNVEDAERAAALLGPANPGRSGNRITLYTSRRGRGAAPEAITRLLRKIGRAGIRSELELVSAERPEVVPPQASRQTLAEAWDAAVAGLPEDWSDVYGEIELYSTDYLEPAALALAPVNPARYGPKPGFRFRSARQFGYGASPEMTRRCLERLDERGIRGEVRILRSLSDTKPVATQGPVWYVGGRSV